MFRYIQFVLLIFFSFVYCLPVTAREERVKKVYEEEVADSILQNIFQVSPLYSKIIDEYEAELYMKGSVKVHKQNRLIKYVPSMFRLEKGVRNYIVESISDLHYTAPDIYERKVKARTGTFRKNRGQLTDLTDFVNMNVYASSLMRDRLLSPLDKGCSKYYMYLLDSIVGPSDSLRYKIRIVPKINGNQLVSGYIWVSDQVWSIRELDLKGKYETITFNIKMRMGKDGDEEFLPVFFDLNLHFRFIGNHIEMNVKGTTKYDKIVLYSSDKRRKSHREDPYDLTEFYDLSCDTSQLVCDLGYMAKLRPIPLSQAEDSLYAAFQQRNDTTHQCESVCKKKNSLVFWGQLGDWLISSYNVNLAGVGSVRCSPLINPVMLSYSHSRGVSYKQKFKYYRMFPNSRILRVTPQVGYNFTHKEFYVKGDMDFLYWPKKQGSILVQAGKGNPMFSSVILDQLEHLPDSLFSFDKFELNYFNDAYVNVLHSIEPVNGLFVKMGVSMHWRNLKHGQQLNFQRPSFTDPNMDWSKIREHYNSFAPRIRVEWTPRTYYYMNGNRKMNVGSAWPTFSLDYEHGLKGVLESNDKHERWEFDVQQKIPLGRIRSLGYRIGGGMFTRMDNMYFVDFVNFSRSNLPEGWNDEIGGTFQLLDGRWYNSSRQYWRANIAYETPFILFKKLNRWVRFIQEERIYAGVLFMPHLNPYLELGYGIGTHVFDVGAFVNNVNGKFDTVGFKFTFELFRD